MPANEQTWRNQKKMHIFFAVSTAVMLVATIWMMAADHFREWKTWQLKDRDKEARMLQSRRDGLAAQYGPKETELKATIDRVDSEPIDATLIEEFKAAVRAAENPEASDGVAPAEEESSAANQVTEVAQVTPVDDGKFEKLDRLVEELKTAAANARKLAADAGQDAEKVAAAKNAHQVAAKARQAVLAELDKFIREARRVESRLVGIKKVRNGERTAAVSSLGIKIGEHAPQEVLDDIQKEIDKLDRGIAMLTDQIASAKDFRVELEDLVAKANAEKAQAVKDFEALKTDLARLDDQIYKSSPNLGERITRLPVVNALYSGNIRIDQNWLPDLTINYNFAQVPRFDRCTTCHRAIGTTAPGTATDPMYPTLSEAERNITVQLPTPAEKPADGAKVVDVYGMQLSKEGIIQGKDVTVHYVLPASPAARAGIEAGDVLLSIGDADVGSPAAAEEWLLKLAPWDSDVEVKILRGLPHPFTAHPRLDLFLSDLSPHPQKVVGCTICHDGQGSGTSFRWSSHTPDNAKQQAEWAADRGWFDNHHWIFPMKPARFVESNCLKCHHQKGSLEPSERFPDPPAPKLVEGWTLVETYGCFGCHEINGYDSPTVTVGPDVRLEPPFHEAAAQILRDRGLTDDQRNLARRLVAHPEDSETRNLLMAAIKQDQQVADNPETKDDAKLSSDTHKLASVLKDIEIPGWYRKVGPSLRFVDSKVGYHWLYSWIRKPADFRPSTRMPQFFGLWEHMSEEDQASDLAESQRLEPIEIRALAEYLLNKSDEFEYLSAPTGITEKASAERGKWLFESRGCLACHTHAEFPGINSTQGPDLSRLQAKLDNEKGRKWLYSWLKQPDHYHARTKMPDLFLEPIEEKDALGKPTGKVSDPAADISAFLLGVDSQWKPEDVPAQGELNDDEKKALGELAELWLASDAIPRARAHEYLSGAGIPKNQEAKLKPDERILVGLTDANRSERLLEFVGRRTISKYGCFGCHDIPGFEDAKPIGTGLVDWGRKEPSKLAFENIHRFLAAHGIDPKNPTGHAHATDGLKSQPTTSDHAEGAEDVGSDASHDESHEGGGHLDPGDFDDAVSYFIQAINSHNRDGFLWQKLRFPRSFDYRTTHNKNFNERLRMPRFPFNDAEREAIMTFVLGLTKEPPAAKYIYNPGPREKAIIEGRQVLEKFNCSGCHTLSMEQWRLAYDDKTFEAPSDVADFPFLAPHFSETEVAESKAQDFRGMMHARLHGEPLIDATTGEKFMVDEDRAPITLEELREAEAEDGEKIPVFYPFTLWRNTLLNGKAYLRGVDELLVPAKPEVYGPSNGRAYPAWGGDLARYLFPKVVERGKKNNPQLNAKEAWGWVPPPLMDEGWKVQTDWLHSFLMDPYPIRPATVLRMPNFHMSSSDAAKLVDFFAASSGAEYPYEYRRDQQSSFLTNLREQRKDPLGEAMNIVTNGNYCVKCHAVADFNPEGDPATFGPNLAEVYRRLRPKFTRDWIANPARILWYTGMPKNIPFYPDQEHLGGVDQRLFHGTSIDQVDGLVSLLMNFDVYARQNTSVTPMVQQAAEAARQAAANQPTGDGGQPQGEADEPQGENNPP